MKKLPINISLFLTIVLITSATYGGQTESGTQPPQIIFLRLGHIGVAGDQNHLYAVEGGMVLEYDVSGMSLLKTVDLPDILGPPQIDPSQVTDSCNLPLPAPSAPGPLACNNSPLSGNFHLDLQGPRPVSQQTARLAE